MNPGPTKNQLILYRVFSITLTLGLVILTLAIWGLIPTRRDDFFLVRLGFTCLLIAVGSALALSASRLVRGGAPEDE